MRTVVRRHAVPSAVAPVFSLTGVTMPIVITNLVLIEQVFSVPGVFTGMRRGIAAGDFDLLFGLTAVAAGLVAVSSLVTDLVLAWLDPRVRAQRPLHPRRDERTCLDRLRRAVAAVGRPVLLHQGRGRRRDVAGLHRLGAGGARRGDPAGAGEARRRARLAARPLAVAGGLRAGRDHDPVPADRRGRAARHLVAGRDPDRGRAAVRRAAGDPLRPGRARERPPAGRAADRAGWRRRADGHRRRGQARRAARRRGDPRRRVRLRRGPDGPQAQVRRSSTRGPRWARAWRSRASR